MKAVATVKQEHIMEAAIKRFTHFGINKTTLGEIAEDLAISKPALFYYFHDKNSLIAAVTEKIVSEFVEEIEEDLKTAESVEKGLMLFVEVKRRFFKKYFLLAIQAESLDLNKLPGQVLDVVEQLHKQIALLLGNLLNKGIEQKAIRQIDIVATSNLMLDTLSAFEICSKVKTSVPGNDEIDALFNKQKEVMKLFVNGLKTSE